MNLSSVATEIRGPTKKKKQIDSPYFLRGFAEWPGKLKEFVVNEHTGRIEKIVLKRPFEMDIPSNQVGMEASTTSPKKKAAIVDVRDTSGTKKQTDTTFASIQKEQEMKHTSDVLPKPAAGNTEPSQDSFDVGPDEEEGKEIQEHLNM